MPLYEYMCEANGQVVETYHSMSTTVETWGQLCELAKLELGDTPADEPVKKIISRGSQLNAHNTFSNRDLPAHKDSGTVAPMRDNKW
ncbi:MAG: zinc ribbon domain-containing protein [Pseudomonadota bacterium]